MAENGLGDHPSFVLVLSVVTLKKKNLLSLLFTATGLFSWYLEGSGQDNLLGLPAPRLLS